MMMDQSSIDARLMMIMNELVRGGISLKDVMQHCEIKYLAVLMSVSKGNVTQASRRAAVHRNTLHNKLKIHDQIPRIRSRRTARKPLGGPRG